MFAYCQNSPVVFSDNTGYRMVYTPIERMGGKPYITDQAAEDVGEKTLGSTTVEHGGCGVVATYNALVDLGASQSFDEVLAYYNENRISRLTADGWLGILPFDVAEYFTDNGYDVVITDSWDAIDIHSQTADANILFYMYTTESSVLPFGAHFISYRQSGNEYVGMNTSDRNGIGHFAIPSSYGYRGSRFYSIGIFIYK